MSEIVLYKNHKNKIGYWKGICTENEVHIEYATGLHDSPQRIVEVITEGKQGRSIREQAQFRLESRANSKIDAGYVRTFEEAQNSPTDANGRKKPMLAQNYKDYRHLVLDPNSTYVQLKYNGHRCLITNENGNIVAYSRNGKAMPGINHILSEIDIPEGVTIDGEIFRKGLPLQEIASLCKKQQENSHLLQFIAYDYMHNDVFSERFKLLTALELGQYVRIAPTKRLDAIDSLTAALMKSIGAGYEGLMIRKDNKPYEDGRRSSSLLKFKTVQDDEFIVLDIISSREGWGILVCMAENGEPFKVSAPGTIQDKVNILKNKEKYIGKYVNVEYSELTRYGIPFHPVAVYFRKEF